MSLSDFQCFSSQKLASPGGMNWRGTWGIPGIYQYGDVVEGPDGEGYVCIDLDGNVGSVPGAAPAVWQLLSNGSATAVSMTAANGSGITVTEPTPNNFTVATNLVAGTGITLTPSVVNTSVTVGVSLPSTTLLVDNRLNPGTSITVATPIGGATTQLTTFPVVAGGVYQVSAAVAVGSTAPAAGGSQMLITVAPEVVAGAPVGAEYEALTVPESTTASSTGASITFTAPAGSTTAGLFVGGFAAVGAITGSIFSLYVTRIA